jgi:catechol 2,3-dioxygenase-like lactoylglutathione lyase family enzyme
MKGTMTTVNVRYIVDDVDSAVAFYTTHLGFTLLSKALPAFADVALGDLGCCSMDRGLGSADQRARVPVARHARVIEGQRCYAGSMNW